MFLFLKTLLLRGDDGWSRIVGLVFDLKGKPGIFVGESEIKYP